MMERLASLSIHSVNKEAFTAQFRLASAGFWTAHNFFRPLLHLGGVIAIMPSCYLLISQIWLGNKVTPSQVTFMVPLNSIPLFICTGIPTLRAAALISFIGGILHLWKLNYHDWQSKMRI